MNRTLKVISLGLFLTLSTVQAQSTPITLNFYRLGGALSDGYINPIIDAFQKENPGIRIASTSVVGAYEELAQKVLLSNAAGTPADLAQSGYSFIRTMVSKVGAVPLDSFISKDSSFKRTDLYPAMLTLGKVSGKLYAMPLATSTPVLYINADAFKKAGLNPNIPPRTWEDVRKAAVKLKAAGYEGVIYDWTVTGNWIFQAMVENAGDKLADAKDNPTFQNAAGQKTASYLADLTAAKLMPVVTGAADATNLFSAGRLGMLVTSTAGRLSVQQASKFDVKMSVMPTPNGISPKLPAGGNGVVMLSKDPARQAAAWKFLAFLTGPTASRIVAQNTGYTPANRMVIEELKVKLASDKNYQVVIAQAPRVIAWQSWPGDQSTQISQTLKDMQQSFLSGRESPQQALNSAAAKVRDLLR